jgi:TonB family protein
MLFSAEISGPVAAGRTVILPQSLLAEPSQDVLTTAIGHEMAHIARRDFACKLAYELLYLPLSFHPAAWLIRRGIEQTREMACDELVTLRLLDAGVYARSIVSIAAQMTALPRPGYTLGVFDGDILEERIRRLLEKPSANLKRARLLLAGGLAALALCAVAASSLSLTARAQGAAGDMIKQGEAAIAKGDYKTAAAQFEAAVRFEPSNLKAKLFLATALLQQYTPGSGASSPLVASARKQFLDVLTVEPSNKEALHGMMNLTANTKQFAESREWAQKAVQADSTDAAGYYMAGFVDWSMTYPDYMRARAAAGMKPPDPGIIPDAAQRQNLRAQHGAQIEDGLHMLDMALQLVPDYSDAMAYINLLDRIKAAMADNDADYQALTAQADDWVGKALEAKRKNAAAARSGQPASAGELRPMMAPPPPPPPPPPPGMANGTGLSVPPNSIRVEGAVQQQQLVKQTPPVYPPLAAQAGVTGTVTLGVLIAKDGTVQNIQVIKGHPLLIAAAIDAVKQWTYRPTLLNGEPVEVATSVNVNFETH